MQWFAYPHWCVGGSQARRNRTPAPPAPRRRDGILPMVAGLADTHMARPPCPLRPGPTTPRPRQPLWTRPPSCRRSWRSSPAVIPRWLSFASCACCESCASSAPSAKSGPPCLVRWQPGRAPAHLSLGLCPPRLTHAPTLPSTPSAIDQQIFTLVLTICTIVFLSAGMVHVVEETMYARAPSPDIGPSAAVAAPGPLALTLRTLSAAQVRVPDGYTPEGQAHLRQRPLLRHRDDHHVRELLDPRPRLRTRGLTPWDPPALPASATATSRRRPHWASWLSA